MFAGGRHRSARSPLDVTLRWQAGHVAEPSDALKAFIAGSPRGRGPHISFLQTAAQELDPGTSLLDVGAGDAPYRELFSHLDYVTCDWENTQYAPAIPSDISGSADSIPVPDASFDAILNTQVLEHVPEPGRVLAEFWRILRPGGRLFISAPLVWYLHEEPHDYYRYTPHGLRYLLDKARFIDVEITPLNDSFSTVAQLMADLGWMMGRHTDGHDPEREVIAGTMAALADVVANFAPYDTQWIFPINYAVRATRPPA
jgi:SAM-dependent methyltransferase